MSSLASSSSSLSVHRTPKSKFRFITTSSLSISPVSFNPCTALYHHRLITIDLSSSSSLTIIIAATVIYFLLFYLFSPIRYHWFPLYPYSYFQTHRHLSPFPSLALNHASIYWTFSLLRYIVITSKGHLPFSLTYIIRTGTFLSLFVLYELTCFS